MPTERRLHPVSLLFRLGERLRELVIPIIVLIFVTRSRSGLNQIATAAVLFALTTLGAAAQYFSFRYRYGDNELVIRWGILFRKQRHIPYERIQNIDAVQGVVQRLCGVVTVVVQTGSGTEPEATLSVLPFSALAEMRERVFAGKSQAAPEAPDRTPGLAPKLSDASSDRVLLHLGPRALMWVGFIENRGITLVLGALGVLSQVDSAEEWLGRTLYGLIPGIRWDELSATTLAGSAALPLWAAALIVVSILFVRLLSMLWALVRLYNFTLTRRGDDLRAEYGLLTRVTATIPIRRIQTVSVHEGFVHRWTNRVAVRVTTAGGGAGQAGTAEREWVAPIIDRRQLGALLGEFYPGLTFENLEWNRPHPRAFGRAARRMLMSSAPLVIAAPFFIGWWSVPLGITLAALAIVRARLRVKHLGWSLTPGGVVFRAGVLRRSTTAAFFEKVQCVESSESPFDRRTGMAEVTIDTAGTPSGTSMPYLPRDVAISLRNLIAERSARTAFTW